MRTTVRHKDGKDPGRKAGAAFGPAQNMREVEHMDGVKTVDDLLREKGVTADEEEKLRDIIEECRLREARIKEASDAARQNIQALSDTFTTIIDTFAVVSKSVDALHEEFARLQLRMMPEEQFFRE